MPADDDVSALQRFGVAEVDARGRFISTEGKLQFPCARRSASACMAPCSLNSRLNESRLTKNGSAPLPPWQDALARFLCAPKQENSILVKRPTA